MLSWFIRRQIKKELQNHFDRLHFDISKAFLHIKSDITNVHSHLGHKETSIRRLEDKIIVLERSLFNLLEAPEAEKVEEPELEEESIVEESPELLETSGLTYTQQTLIAAIHELEKQHKRPISFKSLAVFLYPGKKYGSIRTTLSEYIDFLATYDLVRKEKVGRETVTYTTRKGKKLAKSIIKNKKMRGKTEKRVRIIL